MKHYFPAEILPPEYGNRPRWIERLMRPEMLIVSDALRDAYGSIAKKITIPNDTLPLFCYI